MHHGIGDAAFADQKQDVIQPRQISRSGDGHRRHQREQESAGKP
jgi:hypothetical protein